MDALFGGMTMASHGTKSLRRKLPFLLASVVVVGVVPALLIVSYAFPSLDPPRSQAFRLPDL